MGRVEAQEEQDFVPDLAKVLHALADDEASQRVAHECEFGVFFVLGVLCVYSDIGGRLSCFRKDVKISLFGIKNQ